MRLLICIDDTDNLESKGTGSIASEMIAIIEKNAWGKCGFVSRHQLILHPDVPYTSHNSSMCFDAEIEEKFFEQLKRELTDYLGSESAPGSDPGICIAVPAGIVDRTKIIKFGYQAKHEVLTKDHAYRLAAETGVFLAEAGGSGDGIIGALAGVGLRLSGNDGEVKGEIENLKKNKSYTVAQLLKEELIHAVCTADMKPLAADEIVTIKWKAKPVLCDGLPVLLVTPGTEVGWLTMDKSEMRQFGDKRSKINACANFRADVAEEIVHEQFKSCLNCAFRRWTANSFVCTLAGKEMEN